MRSGHTPSALSKFLQGIDSNYVMVCCGVLWHQRAAQMGCLELLAHVLS